MAHIQKTKVMTWAWKGRYSGVVEGEEVAIGQKLCPMDTSEDADHLIECNAGHQVLIPGSGRSPGKGNDYPLQYSCLENSMDRGSWRTTVYGFTKNGTN